MMDPDRVITEDGSREAIRALKPEYRSGRDHIGRDLFARCLSRCSKYQRAAGYFTSKALITWAAAIPRFALRDDICIEMLVSPNLSDEDREALSRAVDENTRTRLRSRIIDGVILEAIELLANPNDSCIRLELFAWLVATGRLELRFAFPTHVESASLFHEKIGVFTFSWGDTVAFTGSANETSGGHERNYETVDVFRSWESNDEERVQTKVEQFREAWEGTAVGLHVERLSIKTLEKIRALAPRDKPAVDPSTDHIPTKLSKWRHQGEAVEEFLKSRRGVLEMATGTGKTRTALMTMTKVFDSGEISSAIVCTIGTDLLSQWSDELYHWVNERDEALSIYRHFGGYHESGAYLAHPSRSILVISRQKLPAVLNALTIDARRNTIIVHDEVHGLGSKACIDGLRGQHHHIAYVMGLSATPEREYDDEGNLFIDQEIGPIVYRFDLADAIRRGILCEFDYVAIPYELTENDRFRLREVYKQRSAREKTDNPMQNEELWTRLAAVYKTAESKPTLIKEYLTANPAILHSCIIFVYSKEFGDKLVDFIHSSTPRYSTYYDDDPHERLLEFSGQELDCLITCHRLSQGIDIPHLRNVVLVSADRAKLETIQRIGRCLRFDPIDPEKRAKVVDFVRVPDGDDSIPDADTERAAWLAVLSDVRLEG